jgi:hypothetical protein
MTLHALPVTDFHPLLTAALDKACEHRPWFYDYIWEPPELRREVASAYLSDAILHGKLWVVLSGAEVVGLCILNTIRAGLDAQCHFLFFDRKLSDKRQLCLNLMQRVFADEELQLRVLRVEIPEYASKLSGFLRKALGFKFESERWLDTVAEAKRSSRKYEATCYEGKWQDVLLLSVTREEFLDHVRSQDRTAAQRADGAEPGADSASPEHPPGSAERPAELSEPSSSAERAPTASRADI